jgi:hypothetical protein
VSTEAIAKFSAKYGQSSVLFVPRDRASRRLQLSIRCSHRIYDWSIARLGAGKPQRYFAFDFDQFPNSTLAGSKQSKSWPPARSHGVLHWLGQYSNALLDRSKNR